MPKDKNVYSIAIDCTIHNKEALYDEAKRRAIRDGATARGLRGMIGTKKQPDICGCLQMILDPGISPPGTSILQSRRLYE